ncbi:MAG: intradiol ring-cleavage dioxygenase [Planctomycetaceae bacterium]
MPASRRRFLQHCAFTAAAFSTSGLFAEQLARTPRQTEGPFYPDKLPLDTDNDLLILNDSITQAVGKITHLSGRVLDTNGKPAKNVGVEIWQVDGNGSYLHSRGAGRKGRDKNFQGFGRFTTNRKGEYYFRTIQPVPYPGRTPHIHFAVNRRGKRLLTTQCYIKGEPLNAVDGILSRMDKTSQQRLIVDFKPLKRSKHGERAAIFDIVLGVTPEDG